MIIVLSGYLPSSLKITANTALQTVTSKDFELNLNPDVEVEDYFRLTDENMDAYADCVFSDLSGDHPLVEAEQIMYTYYANKLHLNYIDLF